MCLHHNIVPQGRLAAIVPRRGLEHTGSKELK